MATATLRHAWWHEHITVMWPSWALFWLCWQTTARRAAETSFKKFEIQVYQLKRIAVQYFSIYEYYTYKQQLL